MVDGPDSAWRNRAPGPHGNTARQATDGLWTEARGQRKQSNDPQYANYWARKRHIPPHSAQPQHTNHWAPRTRKRHQREHRPQRPTESSDPTQHAKGRTGDCPGPREGATTRRNVTRGGGGGYGHPWDKGSAAAKGREGTPLQDPEAALEGRLVGFGVGVMSRKMMCDARGCGNAPVVDGTVTVPISVQHQTLSHASPPMMTSELRVVMRVPLLDGRSSAKFSEGRGCP